MVKFFKKKSINEIVAKYSGAVVNIEKNRIEAIQRIQANESFMVYESKSYSFVH